MKIPRVPPFALLGIIALLLLALAAPAAAGVGIWTPLGPDGATATYALAVDPVNPQVVYAGTQSGIYKSTDGGATWRVKLRGLPADGVFVRTLAIGGGVIYAGTHDDGIFKSTDGGETWVSVSNGIPRVLPGFGPQVGAIVIDPRQPNRVWAGTWRGIFLSTNGGASWTTRNSGPPFDTAIQGLAIDPANGQIFFSSSRGVFTSTDDARRWTKVSRGLHGASYFDLLLDPENPSTLFVGSSLGLWRTDNRGGRWEQVKGLPNLAVLALALQGDRLFAGVFAAGIFHSDDRGKTWTAAQRDPEDDGVVELAAGPGALFAGTAREDRHSGVFRSLDRGATWERASRGIQSMEIFAAAVDPTDADVLYVSALGEGFFKSVDRGASWERLDVEDPLAPNRSPAANSLLVDPADPSNVYASSFFGGIYRSQDAGETWEHDRLGETIEGLAPDPRAAGAFWAAGSPGLFHTADGGETWQRVPLPGGDVWIRAFEVDPTDPRVLWAGGGIFVPTSRGTSRLRLRLFRSADGGQTWQRRETGIDAPVAVTVHSLAIDPADPDTVYAGTDFGLYRTTNAGLNWTKIPGFNLPIDEIVAAPAMPTAIYVWLPGFGVRRSTDQGATWTAVRRGLLGVPLLDLIVDPTNPRRLYAGTATRGLFTYEEPPGD
jgi:photosystem II stability/assembly factor-like uncharacterized protein